MAESVQKIRVFVASPSDVQAERTRVGRLIEKLNRTFCPQKGVVLEVVRWETNATPDMGRAQNVINRQIGEVDIVIGIMWKRFGSPTGMAESGTEEEFNLAYDSWKRTGKPRIMFYFNQRPYTLRGNGELSQVQKVLNFREQVQKLGLIWEYATAIQFENDLTNHLINAIHELTDKTLPVQAANTSKILRIPAKFGRFDRNYDFDNSIGRTLVIKAKISTNRLYEFMLDSGAEVSVISNWMAKMEAIRTGNIRFGGDIGNLYRINVVVEDMLNRNINQQNNILAVGDNYISERFGADGLLGANWLSRFKNVALDWNEPQLIIHV